MPPRVLIVDDDPAIRAALVAALDDGTIEIDQVGSTEEALGVLDDRGAPDVVLSDIRMKGLDGIELLRVVKERSPESRVVMMTAYHDVGTAVTAMREGASDFLCKPFDLPVLRDVVGRMLGRSPTPETTAHPAAHSHAHSQPHAHPHPDAVREARPGPPLLAGRYRLRAEIGRGAMSTVYRAEDTRHGRDVAVKILRPEVAVSIGVGRFLREIQISARLNHPHILTLIDSGEWQGAPFFVMPFVDGRSLRHRLDAEPPPEIPVAASLLRAIADALAYAHDQSVVHRDVKPSNVLLSGRHAWVADFGVARALSDASGAGDTVLGTAIGTPAYMAPEQVGDSGAVDHRADLYAFGVLAYELLTGRHPFPRRSAAAMLAAHLFDEPAPPSEKRPDVPPALEEIVIQCLAKAAVDRPRRAADIARRLGAFQLEPAR